MATTTAEQKLERMRKLLDSRKAEIASLRGERKQLLSQLKALGAASVEEAEEQAEEAEQEAEALERQVEEAVESLERDYEW